MDRVRINTITRVARPLDDDWIAHLTATTQGLDDSVAADDLMARPLPPRLLLKQLEASMTQWLADNPMARRYEQTFSIRADVLDTTRDLGLGLTT